MMRLRCPHCNSKARIRTSRDLSPKTREQQCQCENIQCAHTWVVITEAVRTIAPSMTPNPSVFIPLSPRSPAVSAPNTKQMGLDLDYASPR